MHGSGSNCKRYDWRRTSIARFAARRPCSSVTTSNVERCGHDVGVGRDHRRLRDDVLRLHADVDIPPRTTTGRLHPALDRAPRDADRSRTPRTRTKGGAVNILILVLYLLFAGGPHITAAA